MALILIGFMAAGKTSVARLLDPNFIDSDNYIAKQVGMSTADYFDAFGEVAFRKLEERALERLLANHQTTCHVIATGGGVVESKKNQTLLLKENQVVYLRSDFEDLLSRLQEDRQTRRSLFEKSSPEEFKKIFDRRLLVYEKLSDFIIDTKYHSPEKVAEEILRQVKS